MNLHMIPHLCGVSPSGFSTVPACRHERVSPRVGSVLQGIRELNELSTGVPKDVRDTFGVTWPMTLRSRAFANDGEIEAPAALECGAKMALRTWIGNKLRCWTFRVFPCYRGTGGRLTHIAADWSEVRLEIPLRWRTRNYVGTIFGGSLYGAVDPVYMIMLIKRLGPEYVVWDKSAAIQFKKPGRETLYARFAVLDEELAAIRAALETQRSVDRTYSVDLADAAGTVCATIEKVIYIRRREPRFPNAL